MANESTLDLDSLTGGISEESPAGGIAKEVAPVEYSAAKDARNAAVGAEDKRRELAMYSEEQLDAIREEDRVVEPPDWHAVHQQCQEILTKHSKDLWVAAWLVESSTRLDSFAGLRDAYVAIKGIIESHWDSISPPPDEDEGYSWTVAHLSNLNGTSEPGTLIAPLEELALLPDLDAYSLMTYRRAIAGAEVDVSEGEFLSAARQIDPQALRDWQEDIDQAIESFEDVNALLQDRCGTFEGMPAAPPSNKIRETLQSIRETFALITRDVFDDGSGGELSETQDDAAEASLAVGGQQAVSGVVVDPAKAQIAGREDAFRLLLKVSEFFRKTEPHSPVSYMLQQAVRFGRMELPDLLKELIKDDDVLKQFGERTGIEVEEEDDD
ncbi:MAG: type VI secretion system protein TssA [Planctomycetota bacterium]